MPQWNFYQRINKSGANKNILFVSCDIIYVIFGITDNLDENVSLLHQFLGKVGQGIFCQGLGLAN